MVLQTKSTVAETCPMPQHGSVRHSVVHAWAHPSWLSRSHSDALGTLSIDLRCAPGPIRRLGDQWCRPTRSSLLVRHTTAGALMGWGGLQTVGALEGLVVLRVAGDAWEAVGVGVGTEAAVMEVKGWRARRTHCWHLCCSRATGAGP